MRHHGVLWVGFGILLLAAQGCGSESSLFEEGSGGIADGSAPDAHDSGKGGGGGTSGQGGAAGLDAGAAGHDAGVAGQDAGVAGSAGAGGTGGQGGADASTGGSAGQEAGAGDAAAGEAGQDASAAGSAGTLDAGSEAGADASSDGAAGGAGSAGSAGTGTGGAAGADAGPLCPAVEPSQNDPCTVPAQVCCYGPEPERPWRCVTTQPDGGGSYRWAQLNSKFCCPSAAPQLDQACHAPGDLTCCYANVGYLCNLQPEPDIWASASCN